ncbi:hypothetical protein L2E82_49589 [Cichorium intybus]|uniref:Uncharacterized protein n=1 Tax=Cichorium intybus TaxID=13427 RepID=A0ACB8Z0W6_CICIN|nr:hypothetical protein L2E82_49589 [Cichorium intybus]
MHIQTLKSSEVHGTGKVLWTGNVKGEKERSKLLSARANTLLKNLKLQFSEIPNDRSSDSYLDKLLKNLRLQFSWCMRPEALLPLFRQFFIGLIKTLTQMRP